MFADISSYSSPGGREINEDSYFCGKGVWAVADGLGGHECGEKASAAAAGFIENNACVPYTDESIKQLLEGANEAVIKSGCGGNSTVAAAFEENGVFRMANVGDSRVYYFREGKIIAQTKDHSVCQAAVDMGTMTADEIRGSEDRPLLLKVLGENEKLNIKKSYPPIDIKDGDAFLICSDGFWENIYETEMETDLLKSESAEKWLSYMLKRHILKAENKGDNYTAVCGFFRSRAPRGGLLGLINGIIKKK